MWWSCAGSRGLDGAHDGALHEFDLEVVVPASLRALRGECRRPAKRCGVQARSTERRLDPRDAPGLGADPAEGDARLPDAAAIHVERHRGGYHRELEGGAVAHLEVMRASSHGARR